MLYMVFCIVSSSVCEKHLKTVFGTKAGCSRLCIGLSHSCKLAAVEINIRTAAAAHVWALLYLRCHLIDLVRWTVMLYVSLAFTRSQIRSTMPQGIPVFNSVCIAMCSKQLVCLHTFSRLPSWHSLQSSKQIKVFLRRPKFQGVFPDSMLAEKGMQKQLKTQQIQTVVAPKVVWN